MNKEIILAGACRTAIGKFGGAIAAVPAVELGAIVIREALKRAAVPADKVDEVYMGCVLQAALGQNVGRQAAIKAGLPVLAPAITLNAVCGSGLHCVNLAATMIRSGQADIAIACGAENMSAAPFALDKARYGYRMGHGALIDTMVTDALTDAFTAVHMGITAENVAAKFNITRLMQDEFAASSQQKAEKALQEGNFKDEIVAVPIKRQKDVVPFEIDEYPRSGVTVESLAGLRPAFKPDGTVTAGNASGINDGAAAVVVMSRTKADELGVKPLAKWLGGAIAGVEPEIMGIGPVKSTEKLLQRLGMNIGQMDLVEGNEAFAAQVVAVGNLLGLDPDKLNVNGGAIALGHPVGASGCRILVTLLHELRRRNGRFGLATLCVGGGMGVSCAVENIRT